MTTSPIHSGNYKDITEEYFHDKIGSLFGKSKKMQLRLWRPAPNRWNHAWPSRCSTTSSTRLFRRFTLKRLPNRPKPGTYPQPLCTGHCSLSADVVMLICPAHSQEITMLEHTVCPVCHQPAIDITLRTRRSIATADAICANHHIWEIRWLLPVVPIRDQEAS